MWIISIAGTSAAIGKQVVGKGRRQGLAAGVETHALEQRVAEPVHGAADHLAVDDHRVDDVAAVVHEHDPAAPSPSRSRCRPRPRRPRVPLE